MSQVLIAVEDMAEIPKDTGTAPGRGSSKGVNLFLARQKLIADMMEQEEQEEKSEDTAEGCTTRVHKPAAFAPSKENITTSSLKDEGKKLATSICFETQAMSSTQDDQLLTVEAMSEIPHTTQSSSASGGSRSKGANLFLARQKLIADMMAAEEEAEKAAEEAKRNEKEEKIRQTEVLRKQEAEKQRLEEHNRQEREKLLDSEKAKAARAARFKTSTALTEGKKEPDLPWVKKKTKSKAQSGEPRKTLYQLLSADKK